MTIKTGAELLEIPTSINRSAIPLGLQLPLFWRIIGRSYNNSK
jgi:hypothetical protein